MKLSKKSLNLIIFSIYIIVLLLGGSASISINNIYNYIKNFLLFLIPSLLILLILFENKKNLKILLKNKLVLILYLLTILSFLLSIIFGIRIGIESIKGFIHFGILLTMLFVISNCEITNEQKKLIKKHLFISFIITALFGIFEYIFKFDLNTFSNEKYPGINGRIASTFYTATLYDKYVLIMFCLITNELLKDKNNFFYRLLLIISMLAITFTFSRTGLLIYLFMSFLFLIITLFKKQFKNSCLIVCLVILMILIPGSKYPIQSGLDYAYDTIKVPNCLRFDLLKVLGSELKEDVEAGGCAGGDCVGDVEGSKFFRDYYDSVGMALLNEHKLFGVGTGNYLYLFLNQNAKKYLKNNSFITDEYDYMYPHNAYIYLGAEVGYVGLILIILFMLSVAISKIKEKNNIYIIISLILVFFIAGLKEGLFHGKQIIYIFMLIYGFCCAKDYKKE